jgi:hypothetical protein
MRKYRILQVISITNEIIIIIIIIIITTAMKTVEYILISH